jgi:hypothetical protein
VSSRGSSSGGGEKEPFTGRAAIGYDHGYDAEVFYLGLALDPAYVEGFVEGCLERIGEDNPEEEEIFRDLWEDETQREIVIDCLKADCEIRVGRPPGFWEVSSRRSGGGCVCAEEYEGDYPKCLSDLRRNSF